MVYCIFKKMYFVCHLCLFYLCKIINTFICMFFNCSFIYIHIYLLYLYLLRCTFFRTSISYFNVCFLDLYCDFMVLRDTILYPVFVLRNETNNLHKVQSLNIFLVQYLFLESSQYIVLDMFYFVYLFRLGFLLLYSPKTHLIQLSLRFTTIIFNEFTITRQILSIPAKCSRIKSRFSYCSEMFQNQNNC